jgi:ribonuclease-3
MSVLGKLFVGTRKGPSGDRIRQLKRFQKSIGIRFTDISLLEQALTHRSYSHVTSLSRNDSNERMEFLGDSVLGLAVSQFLYLKFPDRSEGALSKMKSLLVSRKVLSSVARDVGFGEYLLLSGEESEMGGRDRSSILADSFEGVIGAIYLDQGYRASNKFIQRFLLANIHTILKDEEHTNFKSLLQEFVQSKRLSHPVYRVRREEGPEHEKEFAIEVVVRGDVWGTGRGKSKKEAEQNAARAALERKQGRAAPERGGGRRAGRSDRSGRAAAERRRIREPRAEESAGPSRPASRSTGPSRTERGGNEGRPDRVARHRGEHGIAASREKILHQRRVELEERERAEREARERRRSARRRREEAARARETTSSTRPAPSNDRSGTTEAGPADRRGPRRGRRRRPGQDRDAEAESAPRPDPSPATATPPGASSGVSEATEAPAPPARRDRDAAEERPPAPPARRERETSEPPVREGDRVGRRRARRDSRTTPVSTPEPVPFRPAEGRRADASRSPAPESDPSSTTPAEPPPPAWVEAGPTEGPREVAPEARPKGPPVGDAERPRPPEGPPEEKPAPQGADTPSPVDAPAEEPSGSASSSTPSPGKGEKSEKPPSAPRGTFARRKRRQVRGLRRR